MLPSSFSCTNSASVVFSAGVCYAFMAVLIDFIAMFSLYLTESSLEAHKAESTIKTRLYHQTFID